MGQGGGIIRKGGEQIRWKNKQTKHKGKARRAAHPGLAPCGWQTAVESPRLGRRSSERKLWGLVLLMLLMGSVLFLSVVSPLSTQHEDTKLPRIDGNYQVKTWPFMPEAQSGRGLFSSQNVCCPRLKFTLSKSRHLPILEKKNPTVSAMVPRDWQRQTAWQLAGALAVMGIKWSGRGLLMPDRNNRNQLLRWERGHLPCQLQLGTVEGRDKRACLAWGAAVLLPILQPHRVPVWCPCLATLQHLLVGERSGERKPIWFCV